jgi:hypothetical protein
MRLIKRDPTAEALIDIFNEQTATAQWDAAYGTAIALEERLLEMANSIRESVISQLKIGVVNRAKQAAEEKTKKKK